MSIGKQILTFQNLKQFIVFAFMFACIAPFNGAHGQQVLQKIEAVVNDEIISGYDLQQRLNLIVVASGSQRSAEEMQRLRGQVLRSIVDERLQLQEANKYEVEIEQAQLDEAFVNIARNFKLEPDAFEQFLAQSGTSKNSLFDQLRAEFAWQAIVNGRLGQQISITDEEVEERIQRIIANTGKYEYRLGEIYLIVGNPSQRNLVLQTADRLYEQLTKGSQFFILAQQFSETSTASAGGDMGWVSEDQLSRELKDVVSQMAVGDISIPVFSGSGYHILNLLDRRRILSVDPMDVVISLHSLQYNFPKEMSVEQQNDWIVKSDDIMKGMNSCDEMASFAEKVGITDFGELGVLPMRQLNPFLQPIISALEVGKSSKAIATPDSVRFFVVCSKEIPEIVQPTFNKVYDQLEQERLALMARRYLRDLRRDSIVDYN